MTEKKAATKPTKKTTKTTKKATKETKIVAPASKWEENTTKEINTLLSSFLPISKSGNIGIKYKPAVQEETEGGPVYDDTKVQGVQVIMELDFTEEIDKP